MQLTTLVVRRFWFCLTFAALSLVSHSALSQQALPAFGTPERAIVLDNLYKQLRETKDPAQAARLTGSIWQVWLHHGDPVIDELMLKAQSARLEFHFEEAVSLTDKIIELAPDYAEGWNQRATLRFLQHSYEKSLEDVAETLKREPRHFGALSGRAMIRHRQGKPALAIQNLLRALEVNPHLRERRLLKELGHTDEQKI